MKALKDEVKNIKVNSSCKGCLEVDSDAPLATMNYAQLYSFLNELYTNTIQDWVKSLMDKKDRY